MNLTPELLLEAKFAVSRKGYEVNEVDDFLERCAEGLDVLLTRLRSEFERAEAAEARATELQTRLSDALSSPPAPPVPPAPEAEVAPAPPEAEPEAAPEPEPSVEEPMRILVAAERTAEAAIASARAEADRMKAEAETLVSDARAAAEAEARRAGEEARRNVEAEVLELRRDRDELTTDVRSLSRWLDDQRGRIRAAARDLGRILEDPAALREAPMPEAIAGTGPSEGSSTSDAPDEDSASDGTPTQASAIVPGPDGIGTADES